jgi:hypothetical protein
MCGWLSPAVIRISLRKRSAPTAWASSGLQDLESDLTAMLQVLGQVHSGHTATTKLTLDSVAIRQCGLQAVQDIGHGSSYC